MTLTLEDIVGLSYNRHGTDKIEKIPTDSGDPLVILRCSQIKPLINEAERYMKEIEEKHGVYRPNYNEIEHRIRELGYGTYEVMGLVGYLYDVIKDYYSPKTPLKTKKYLNKVRALAFLLETMDPKRKDYQVIVRKMMNLYGVKRSIIASEEFK